MKKKKNKELVVCTFVSTCTYPVVSNPPKDSKPSLSCPESLLRLNRMQVDPAVVFNEDGTMILENYNPCECYIDHKVYGTVNLNNNQRLPIVIKDIVQVYRMTVLYIRKYYRAISFFLENRLYKVRYFKKDPNISMIVSDDFGEFNSHSD